MNQGTNVPLSRWNANDIIKESTHETPYSRYGARQRFIDFQCTRSFNFLF
jgi:hypothetical protein